MRLWVSLRLFFPAYMNLLLAVISNRMQYTGFSVCVCLWSSQAVLVWWKTLKLINPGDEAVSQVIKSSPCQRFLADPELWLVSPYPMTVNHCILHPFFSSASFGLEAEKKYISFQWEITITIFLPFHLIFQTLQHSELEMIITLFFNEREGSSFLLDTDPL